MKPTIGSGVIDEMFPEGGGFVEDEATGNNIPVVVVDSNREGIHSDFKNDFRDIFDDDDLS